MPYDKDAIKASAADCPVAAYERAGLPPGALRRVGANWQTKCPFHQDSAPSFTVFKDGHFRCFGCQFGGDGITILMRRNGSSDFAGACDQLSVLLEATMPQYPVRPAAQPPAAPAKRPDLSPIAPHIVESLHTALLADERRLGWLCTRKALTVGIIKLAKLGLGTSPHVRWGGLRFTISSPDLENGETWRDIRGYRPGATKTGLPKVLPWQAGRGAATIYPWPWVRGLPELVWCEGETDALNLIARGIGALTATCGAGGALSKLLIPDLSGKRIIVCGDADAAGQRLNADLPPRLYAAGAASVHVACWEDILYGG